MREKFIIPKEVKAVIKEVMENRERYVKAYLAETGFLPSECELVERFTATPGERIVTIRRRIDV